MPVSLFHLLLLFNSTLGFCLVVLRWVPCPQDWQHCVIWPHLPVGGRAVARSPKKGCVSLPLCFSSRGRDVCLHERQLLALSEEHCWLSGGRIKGSPKDRSTLHQQHLARHARVVLGGLHAASPAAFISLQFYRQKNPQPNLPWGGRQWWWPNEPSVLEWLLMASPGLLKPPSPLRTQKKTLTNEQQDVK